MNYLVNYIKWKQLFEAEEASLSNVKTIIGLAGATNHPTTNQNALNNLVSGSLAEKIKIIGENKISENQAIAKNNPSVNSTKQWKVINKTVNANSYIKIGNKILNGDQGRPVTFSIKANDLGSMQVEAAGNGIYALGRALPIKYQLAKYPDAIIIIGLNQTKPDSIIANADTAFQDLLGKFKNSAIYTFILSQAVIPGKDYHKDNVDNARVALSNGTLDPNTYTSDYAVPFIDGINKGELNSVSSFNLTDFVKTIQDKKITSYNNQLDGYINMYVDNYFGLFTTAFADRFKLFLSSRAEGSNPAIFQEMYSYIDSWKNQNINKKEEYKSEIKKLFHRIFGVGSNPGSISVPQATAGTKSIKGAVGKL